MNAPKRISFLDKYQSLIFQHQQACSNSFKHLIKSPLTTFITLGVMALVMSLPLGLFWISTNINNVTSQWNKGGELTLFLQENLSQEQAMNLRDRLVDRASIRQVDYQSPEQALNEFKTMTNMGDVMVALDQNPLPGVMIVQPKYAQVEDLQALRDELARLPEVSMAQLDIAWVARLNAVLGMLDQLIISLAFLLGLGLLFVVGNTTRTAITQRQQEILIAKLVGASDAYVCRPFLYTGFCYGLFGALLSLFVLGLVGHSLSSALNNLVQSYQSQWRPSFISAPAMLMIIGSSIAISMLGSWLAVRRYLYQIQPR